MQCVHMTKCDQKTSRDNFFFNFMCIREGLVWHCRRWVSTPFAARLVFCCFFTQLINKLQQCSLCEWIKNILLFVLNTKQPLRDIWLLSYKQNSFQCFLKKIKFWIFSCDEQLKKWRCHSVCSSICNQGVFFQPKEF